MEQNLGFLDFMKTWFPEYRIDAENEEQILQVAAWVDRSPEFSKLGERFHLDRGLLLSGGVGTGKTDLFRIINKCLREFLKSKYAFGYRVAWKYAGEFAKDGYRALDELEKGNMYFDELCLTDDTTGLPNREYVSHYGNKLLIGEEIIMTRYNAFKNFGYQTHFTTNASPAKLMEVYKERAFDRIIEMCNIIVFTGQSRRWMHDPNLHKNLNTPLKKIESAPISDAEHEYNKKMMDEFYQMYITTGKISELAPVHYEILKSYGCDLGGEETLEDYRSQVSSEYRKPLYIQDGQSTARTQDKNNFMTSEAKKYCVMEFYITLHKAGAKSIFGEKDLKITADSVSKIKVEEQNA